MEEENTLIPLTVIAAEIAASIISYFPFPVVNGHRHVYLNFSSKPQHWPMYLKKNERVSGFLRTKSPNQQR